ncbi:MAG: type II toxin-antitoxin system RelE/ParE family toxin [Dysgonamonadaceae bacterium]|nr:type II toxin-antitoxin system RelE/ParE family toxin [Dysgonamonadaceae bacterium]
MKKIIASGDYEKHLTEILEWSGKTFGIRQAKKYFLTISKFVEKLDTDYTYHPECRHLATQSRMYRNIILDAHLIIYRITGECIEVLDIVHSASSISKIRTVRKIRP